MTRVTSDSYPTGSWTKVPFDFAEFDTTGIANTGLNRFTIAQNGKYRLTGACTLAGVPDGVNLAVQFRVNGGTAFASRWFQAGAAAKILTANTETVLALISGDYLELFVTHDGAGALSTTSTPEQAPEMTIEFVGP